MPFITLNNSWSNLAQYYNQNFINKPEIPKIKYSSFDDGLIRGGAFNATLATTQDTLRVGKFLTSGKGGLFIIKQVGLQLANPKLEQTSPLTTLGDTRIYNLGANTLSQVGVEAFGKHIVRHGLLPKFTSTYNYEAVALENNEKQGSIIKLANNTNGEINTNRLVKYLAIANTDSTKSVLLQRYFGGSSSTYGLGGTDINTTSVRTTTMFSDIGNGKFNGFNLLTSDIIQDLTPIGNNPVSELSLEKQLQNSVNVISSGSSGIPSVNYDKTIIAYNNSIAGYNIEQRIGVSTNKNIDSINAINIIDSKTFYGNSKGETGPKSNTINGITGKTVFNDPSGSDGAFANDLIKFRIEFLNNQEPIITYTENNNTISTVNTEILAFRAYIDDFNDGMSAKWDSYRYIGRGEEFYIYNGFSRDISVSFTMHAHNEKEMAPLYSKLNYLMSTFTPDYSSQLKMRGNIAYLTVGDYIYRQPGVFTDIKLGGFMDGSWDIGLDGQYELPRMLKVGLSFKPIHSFLPRRNYGYKDNGVQSFPAAFITPDRRAYPSPRTGTNNVYLNTGGWAPDVNPKA
jgi:hypothetical protein